MLTSPFDRLERLASQVASREQSSYAAANVQQENQQRERRMRQIHSEAMGAFARFDLMLNKLRDRRYGS